MKYAILALAVLLVIAGLMYWGYRIGENSRDKAEDKLLVESLQKALQDRRSLQLMLIKRDSLYSHLRRFDKARYDSVAARSSKVLIVYRQKQGEPVKPLNSLELDSLINLLTQ